jgi:hypothetical protein
MKLNLSRALARAFPLRGVVSPSDGGDDTGFLYRGGSFTTIAPPGSISSTALAVNASGHVVGQYAIESTPCGFLYRDGSYTTIAPPGSSLTYPRAINKAGQIVGGYQSGDSSFGFLYSGGSYTTIAPPDLPPPPRGGSP